MKTHMSPMAIERTVHEIASLLVEDVPRRWRTDNPQLRNAPNNQILELLAWNVFVSFWVNVAASWFYGWLAESSGSREFPERNTLEARIKGLELELAQTRQKLADKDKCQRMSQEAFGVLEEATRTSFSKALLEVEASETEMYLKGWGWSPDEAKERARSLVKLLQHRKKALG
ncbi:MAG TPA: hypothetical protein VK598_02890 [Nitrospiraceae bacterium]|nr:hypothetical protein [Nitrospiraceae bacterium]